MNQPENSIVFDVSSDSEKTKFWVDKVSENKPRNILTCVKEIVFPLLAVTAILIVFNLFFDRVQVHNVSMEPALRANDLILINRLAYKWGEISYGDIIVFSRTDDIKKNYVKRVIGLPGDDILIQNGTLHINGQSVEEPYLGKATIYSGYWQVGKDEVFVLGDNRNVSIDSHNWSNDTGVPIKDIVGKAIFLYWPLNKMEIIK